MNNQIKRSILLLTLSIQALMLIASDPPSSDRKHSFVPDYSNDLILQRIYELDLQVDFKLNAKVKYYIKDYTGAGRKSTEYILGNLTRFQQAFEHYNQKESLPKELLCLSIVESAANPTVTSSVGARGLWQLMPATARQYGLQINDYVDERCDPYKSTEAALSLLSDLFEEFDNWTLAIAAYNCGPGRVRSAIRKSKSKNYWKIKNHLPKQTQDYINKYVAVNYVYNYYMFYNIRPRYPDYTFQFHDTQTIYKFTRLTEIANETGISLKTIQKMNPGYTKGIVPSNPKGNIVILPKLSNQQTEPPVVLTRISEPRS